MLAVLYRFYPIIAKELLQEYILPLCFYGKVCYVYSGICLILLIIYNVRAQKLPLLLSQNFYANTFYFMYIRYIKFWFYSLFYICTVTFPFFKFYKKDRKGVYSYFSRINDSKIDPMIGEMDNAIKAVW